MELSDLLTPQAIVLGMKAASKKQALAGLAQRASELTGLPERQILDVLLERERLGTTGVGRGIAIPHGKIAGLDSMRGVLARLETPVPFDAVDDEPVDILFLLLAPESAGAEHLKALARVSRMLRDRAFCERLRASEDPGAVYAAVAEGEASHAA